MVKCKKIQYHSCFLQESYMNGPLTALPNKLHQVQEKFAHLNGIYAASGTTSRCCCRNPLPKTYLVPCFGLSLPLTALQCAKTLQSLQTHMLLMKSRNLTFFKVQRAKQSFTFQPKLYYTEMGYIREHQQNPVVSNREAEEAMTATMSALPSPNPLSGRKITKP